MMESSFPMRLHRVSAITERRPTTASVDGHGGGLLDTDFARSGYGSGDCCAEPGPIVDMRPPYRWHLGEVAVEFNVIRRWL